MIIHPESLYLRKQKKFSINSIVVLITYLNKFKNLEEEKNATRGTK